MNLQDQEYARYALVQEMMDTIGVVKSFNADQTKDVASKISSVGKLLLPVKGKAGSFLLKMPCEKR